MPGGLWAMSYTLLIFHIRKDKTLKTIIWSIVIPIVGIASEISQFYQLIPGTFDLMDLIMYIVLPMIVITLIYEELLSLISLLFFISIAFGSLEDFESLDESTKITSNTKPF